MCALVVFKQAAYYISQHDCAGSVLRVSKIGVRGTEDFASPELLTGIKLYEDCESMEELEGHTRDVVAADAWSIGGILFNAATGITTP